jgi:hypothetical protein
VFRLVHHHAENETIEPALAEAANCLGEGKAAAVGGFFYQSAVGRHADCIEQCPLSGVLILSSSQFDPERHSA